MADLDTRLRVRLIPRNPFLPTAARYVRTRAGLPSDGLPLKTLGEVDQWIMEHREDHMRKIEKSHKVMLAGWPPKAVSLMSGQMDAASRSKLNEAEVAAQFSPYDSALGYLLEVFGLPQSWPVKEFIGEFLITGNTSMLRVIPAIATIPCVTPRNLNPFPDAATKKPELQPEDELELRVTIDRHTTEKEWRDLYRQVVPLKDRAWGEQKGGRRPSDTLERDLFYWKAVTQEGKTHDEAMAEYSKAHPEDPANAVYDLGVVTLAVRNIERLMLPDRDLREFANHAKPKGKVKRSKNSRTQ